MKWPIIATTILLSTFVPTQQVTYEQKQAYLKKLLSIQQKLQQRVIELKAINKNTITSVQNLKGQPDLQKSLLEQSTVIQRNKIQETYKQTLIPLKDHYWSCKNFSYSQKQLIDQKIKDLKDKANSISKQIQNQKDCSRNIQVKGQIKFLKLHIQSLQNQLSNTCTPLRKDDKSINNLNTPNNWIYGGALTPQQLQNQLQDLKKDNNLVECPVQKPFIMNDKCSACQKSNQIFSLSENKCIQKCPDSLIFLKTNHQCRDPNKKQLIPPTDLNSLDTTKNPFIWGPITQQIYNDKIKQLKDNNVPVQQCTKDKPFASNGSSCVTCPSGQVFNIGTKQCTTCHNGQRYVDKTHQCKQVYKKPNYDSGKNWIAPQGSSDPVDNKIKQYQNQNYPVQQCPSDKPFPTKDLTGCQSCDKYYNLDTGVCQQCNKFFSVKQSGHQCVYVDNQCESGTYWSGEKCIKCVSPGLFDPNYLQCNCPKDTKYDQQTGKCLLSDPSLKNANPAKATNFVGTVPQTSKYLSNCPEDKPFFNSQLKTCNECSLPGKYFNFNNNKCQECDKNTQFNVDSKKCVPAVDILNSNICPNSDNYCCGVPSVDKTRDNCPEDRPFFDGYHCVSCSKPDFFDLKDKQCKKCPSGQSFSSVKKQCVNSAWLLPLYVSNIPSDKNNYVGKLPDVKPNIEGQQLLKCPSEKPFTNGKQCVSCDLPRYFNFDSNQCQICKQGYSFSNDKRQCQKNTVVGKDQYNSNMVNAENFIGKVPQFKQQYSDCPQKARYFNGATCQKCDLPRYWNFDSNECKQCNKDLYFDKQSRQCLYNQDKQSFKTNINESKNIYYNGDFQQLKKQVSKSSKTECASDKPFYDKSSNSCISCTGDSYIFNYVRSNCMKCPGNTHFNEDYHICFQNGVQPTVQRMVMNSVSWI